MSGRSSQRKGRVGELELANLLGATPGRPASYGATPDIMELPGIHVECKRCEKTHISAWMAQAVVDAEKFKDGAPTVFHRRNREGWLVTMKLDDWKKLYDSWKGGL